MWKHVLFSHFICIVISTSKNNYKGSSDVSLPDTKNRIDSDVSYIDDRFERPGEAAPQILNFQLKTADDDPQNIDFRWIDPDTNQPQKIDFHLDLPDSNRPEIMAFNLGSPGLRAPQRSLGHLDGRRRYSNLALRRNINLSPQKIKRGNKKITRDIVTTRNYPFIAAVIINGRLWCAGSLVDVSWVLTAAHCLNFVINISPLKSLGDHVKVRVGSTHAHEKGEVHDVVGAVRHPKFEEEPAPHADIALLKLAVPLELSGYINIIKIYEGVQQPLAQSFIVVAGWGATRGGDMAVRDATPDINSGRLKVRSQSYCIDSYQLVNDFQFTPDLFCASIRNGTRDACLFDAGAPAIQQNMLMGVMSFGPERCGINAQPAVFIKAFYFRDFVKSTISSYKTTQELIEAMQDLTNDLRSPPATMRDGRVIPSALLMEPDEKQIVQLED